MTLREQLLSYCATNVSSLAVRSAATETPAGFTRAELLARSTAAARRLYAGGLRKGDALLLALPTTIDFAPWFWGAQLVGIIPVPTEPFISERRKPAQLEYLRKLAAIANAKAVVVSSGSRLGTGDIPELVFFDDDTATAPDVTLPDVEISEDDIALIQFSSGSTGQPKGCLLRQMAVCANARAWVSTFDYREQESTFNWMPLFHDFGLMVGVLAPVFGGMTSVLLPTEAFVSSPATWLRRLSNIGPVHTAAPSSALALVLARLALRGAQTFALADLRSLICAAEPIYPRVTRQFFELVEPFGFDRNAFFAAYGMSETTVLASGKRGLHADSIVDSGPEVGARVIAARGSSGAEFVNVGRAVAGGEFRVVDNRHQPLPDRHMGHLQLRSPCLMDGYIGNALQTHAALRDGWYSTGDIGYLVDGEFHFVTRSKDLIVVGGRKFAPADIDIAVSEKLELPPSRVASYGHVNELATESIMVAVESRDGDAAKIEQLARAACYERTGIMPAKVHICAVGTIPKTTSGKVRREALRALLEQPADAGHRDVV